MTNFLRQDRYRLDGLADHPPIARMVGREEVPPFGSGPVSSVSPASDASVNSLLAGNKWGGAGQRAVELEYSFPATGASRAAGYGEPLNGFRPLSGAQQAAARSALGRLAEVANITFTEVPDTASNVGTIRFGVSALPATAWAYYPSAAPAGGDVWLGTFYHGSNPSYAEGTYHYHTMLHELGHALGLKHPHDSGGIGGALPASEDWLGSSMMSYRSYLGDSTSGGYSNSFYPTTSSALKRALGASWGRPTPGRMLLPGRSRAPWRSPTAP